MTAPTPSPLPPLAPAAAGPVLTHPLASEAGPATITIRGLVHHQTTHRDILVSKTGDVETAVWLRTSLIDFEPIPGGLVDVTCPAELAAERKLA